VDDSENLFFLQAGQNPDNVKLNILIEGSGTVWADQIVLAKSVDKKGAGKSARLHIDD
jgi:hypothetical protein